MPRHSNPRCRTLLIGFSVSKKALRLNVQHSTSTTDSKAKLKTRMPLPFSKQPALPGEVRFLKGANHVPMTTAITTTNTTASGGRVEVP